MKPLHSPQLHGGTSLPPPNIYHFVTILPSTRQPCYNLPSKVLWEDLNFLFSIDIPGGGNPNIFGMSTPKNWGFHDPIWLYNIFQMGWNHHLVYNNIYIYIFVHNMILFFFPPSKNDHKDFYSPTSWMASFPLFSVASRNPTWPRPREPSGLPPGHPKKTRESGEQQLQVCNGDFRGWSEYGEMMIFVALSIFRCILQFSDMILV